jgi:hypothetical protein
MRVEYNMNEVQDMSYPLVQYGLLNVHCPVAPGLTVPAPLIYPGGQGYMNPSPILAKESYSSTTRVVSFCSD